MLPSYLWSQMLQYRNISQKYNSNTFFFCIYTARAVISHTLPCRHQLQRAWQVWCNKRHSIAQIIKSYTGQFEMSNLQWICKIPDMWPFPHAQTLMTNSHLLPSSLIQYCQGNRRRCNENRTNTQLVLSVHLSSCSLVRWDFTRLTKLVPKIPFNGNIYKVQLCYIKM